MDDATITAIYQYARRAAWVHGLGSNYKDIAQEAVMQALIEAEDFDATRGYDYQRFLRIRGCWAARRAAKKEYKHQSRYKTKDPRSLDR